MSTTGEFQRAAARMMTDVLPTEEAHLYTWCDTVGIRAGRDVFFTLMETVAIDDQFDIPDWYRSIDINAVALMLPGEEAIDFPYEGRSPG